MTRNRIAAGLVCSIAILGAASSARCDLRDDGGGWVMLLATGSFAPTAETDDGLRRLRWWFDLQPRFTFDSDYHQLLVRPGIGYELGRNFSLWLGYAYVDTDPPGRASFDEHRPWQQLLWSTKLDALGIGVRTRLEQRFIQGGSDTGWRFRQFVKLTHPLAFQSRLGLAAYEEAFVDLNDTDWGADAGFAQNRLFAGLSWKLAASGRAVVELGYLNQYIGTTGRPDVMNHLASLNILMNLP